MKTITLFLTLFFSTLTFGQVKKIRLTDDDVNMLASRIYNIYGSQFNTDEIEKLNLKNTLGFLLEFEYEGNVIYSQIITLTCYTGSELTYYLGSLSQACFKTTSVSNEVIFNLLKERWVINKVNENEEYLCTPISNNVKMFHTEDRKTYKMNSLSEGKIKFLLYRLER